MARIARIRGGEPRVVRRDITLTAPEMAVREAVRPAAARERWRLGRIGKRGVESMRTVDIARLILGVRELTDVASAETIAVVAGNLVDQCRQFGELCRPRDHAACETDFDGTARIVISRARRDLQMLQCGRMIMRTQRQGRACDRQPPAAVLAFTRRRAVPKLDEVEAQRYRQVDEPGMVRAHEPQPCIDIAG